MSYDIESNQQESDEAFNSFRRTEEEGQQNILKHFDRIHDKLFDLNNILIAGFLAFSQLGHQLPKLAVLAPIFNLLFLIFIEYKMMEKSRFESNITRIPMNTISNLGKLTSRVTLMSFGAILTTISVIAFFVISLWD